MSVDKRKEVYIFRNTISNSTLITDQKKVADYLKTKGKNHEYKSTFFIEISETNETTPLYCYQDYGKKNYLYYNEMLFEKENWDLVKLLGHMSKNPPKDEESTPLFQVGEEPLQYLSKDDSPEKSDLIGFFYHKNRTGIDYLAYPSTENNEEETEEKKNEEEEEESVSEEKKEEGNEAKSKELLVIENTFKKDKTPTFEELTEIERLSRSDHLKPLISELIFEFFKSSFNQWMEGKPAKELLYYIGIVNNLCYHDESLQIILKNEEFIPLILSPILKKGIKLETVLRSILVLLQTSTRSQIFLDHVSSNEEVNVTGSLLMFIDLDSVKKNYRFSLLGHSILSNCCDHKVLVNTLILHKNRFLEFQKQTRFGKKVVFVRTCMTALYNMSKVHNDILEGNEQILTIVNLVKTFGRKDEGIVLAGLSLLSKISLFYGDHGIDLSFLNGFRSEFFYKPEIGRLIDTLLKGKKLLNK